MEKIQGKSPLFGRAATIPHENGGSFIETFTNGGKAVNLLMVEETEDETARKLNRNELQSYADELMDGGADTRGLMVGKVFSGENAEEDARREADRIDEEFNPGMDATDDELLDAAEDAKGGAAPSESPVNEPGAMPGKTFGGAEPPAGGAQGNPSVAAGLPKPSFGSFGKAPEKKKTIAEDIENEPMLSQLKGK